MRKASEKDRAFETKNDSSERDELAFATSCPFRYAIGPTHVSPCSGRKRH